MKRYVAILVIAFLFPQIITAKPWYKDWKAWLVIGASIGSSAAVTHFGHECRRQFGPAPCAGGYGPFAARESVRMGVNVGLTGVGLGLRHDGDKAWPVIPLGAIAYNTVVAFRESRVGCPAGQEFVYGTKRCHPAD